MVTLTIDGQKVRAKEETTLLEICRKMSIPIPALCYHPDLTPQGSCRLCTVEVFENGRTRMVTACNYPVRQGIKVETHSDRVLEARRVLAELLLARCPRAPFIQDLARELGVKGTPYRSEHPENDCFLCGLCVRACNEIAGANAIGFSRRGTQKKIGTPFEIDSERCTACGACESVCPTGAVRMEMNRTRKMKLSDSGTRRQCRYVRLGLVDFMVCSNGFECWRCEVDQGMEDRFGMNPVFALKPGKKSEPSKVNGFIYVPGCLYSHRHLWAKPVGSSIRFGLDNLLSHLAAAADSISFPRIGSDVSKGDVLVEMVAERKKAKILSPLSGKVIAVNRDVEETPNLAWRAPYGRGWLLMLEPSHPEEVSSLYSGESAKRWFTVESKKVANLLADGMTERSNRKGPSGAGEVRKRVRGHWDRLRKILLG